MRGLGIDVGRPLTRRGRVANIRVWGVRTSLGLFPEPAPKQRARARYASAIRVRDADPEGERAGRDGPGLRHGRSSFSCLSSPGV